MIHFFPRFATNAAETPFGAALRATGAPHRIYGSSVKQTYRHRWQLLLFGYPALAWTALITATRSLLLQDGPAPAAVVVSSDVEVLIFALIRLIPGAAKPRIVLVPFIFTARGSDPLSRIRLAYYRVVMARVACAICHSRLETTRYTDLFRGTGASFVFVPWGTHVPGVDDIIARAGPLPVPDGAPVLVAAGKSGRDYPTLAAATAGLPCRVRIICNEVAALGGVTDGPNLAVLQNCIGRHYLRQLLAADLVIIPLLVDDISAGQMVMVQAMALGRPLIVTSTPTVTDYLEDGRTALLVPRGDVPAMRAAITRLLADPELSRTLAANALADYAARFSGEAFQRNVVAAVQAACRPR